MNASAPDHDDTSAQQFLPHPDDEKIEDLLLDLFGSDSDIVEEFEDQHGRLRAISFGEAGVLTRDRGVVLRFDSGVEFQITVVQSRSAR